ncbi:STAS domain-containing protein [Streptomyces sp. NPDC005574]|uniref:STAS domain-containing protein n=1 Tax=Streptomyces sp. NPDC005574 TaxID=3156891 RepID=UPI0033B464E7
MTQALSITRSTTGNGVTVVRVKGDIDFANGASLREALEVCENAAAPRIVVDLSEVPFLDSAGVNIVIETQRAVEEAHGWLRLAAPQPAVARVLTIVSIDQVIGCYSTLEKALVN